MTKSRSKTAAEFAAELASNTEYQKRLAERQAIAAAQGQAAAEDERPLVGELQAAGVAVASVYDFIGKSVAPTPSAAAPVLVKHLSLPHIQVIREGIIRALSCSHLRSHAFEALKSGFAESDDQMERWLFANALAAMAGLDELRQQLAGIQEYAELFRSASRH
jgi:hypothetical protein